MSPSSSIMGVASATSCRATARIVAVCAVGAQERVRAGRPGEVVEAQAEHDRAARRDRPRRMRRVTRSTRPTSTASIARRPRRPRPPERVLRTDRPAPAADLDRPRVVVVRERVQVPARRRGRASRRSTASSSRATSPTVEMPRSWSLRAVTAPTPQSRSTGSGCRNVELAVGRHDEQAVGLGDPARDLREELGARDADGDAQPDPFEHVAAQPRRDLDRRARDAGQAADVEERLVDREPLDERRRVGEHLEHRLARLGVGRHARRHDDRAHGQSRRACAPPIAVRTPNALAS